MEQLKLAEVQNFDPEIAAEGGAEGQAKPALWAKIVIHLRNFGRVPARNIKVYSKTYLARIHMGRFYRFKFNAIDTWICAPGHERRVFSNFYISSDEREDFDSSILEVVIRLRFTFEDEAGNTYQEKAAFRLSGADLETFYLLPPFSVAAVRHSWKQYELYAEEPKQRKARKPATAKPRRPRRKLPKPKEAER